MNDNIKNLFEYLRDIYKLKTKVVTDYNKYEKVIDLEEFKNRYKSIAVLSEFSNTLSLDNETFTLKYIMEQKKYPEIPEELVPYVQIVKNQPQLIKNQEKINKVENAITVEENIDNTESLLEDNNTEVIEKSVYEQSTDDNAIPQNILDAFEKYKEEYHEVRKENLKIERYNALYEYLYKIYKRKEDFEEKIEIILAKGLFEYKPTSYKEPEVIESFANTEVEENDNNQENVEIGYSKDSFIIKRHVLEFPLQIEVTLENNTINLRLDKTEKCNLESNFLSSIQELKIKDQEALFALKSKVESDFEENEILSFSKIYEEYLNDISFKFEYIGNSDDSDISKLEAGKCYIFEKDCIIIRKKQPTVWLDDLNNIVNELETKGEFNSENKLMELILETDEEKMNKLLNVPAENERVLFPLPTNDEQYKVVEQTEHSNLVLVQGPPGTGKSHTIANLISNYVARGKRVLITSEKSKALEVIREKLPEEIRNLSMAILNDKQNDNDLSNSIQIVLDKYKDKEYLGDYLKRIEKLEKELEKNNNEKIQNQKEILELLSNSTKDYKDEVTNLVPIQLENYMLIGIAKYLHDNEYLDVIEDKNVNVLSNLHFDKNFLLELNPLVDELSVYKDYIIDRENDLPTKEKLNIDSYKENLLQLQKLEQEKVVENFIRIGLDEKSLSIYDLSGLEKKLNRIINLERLYARDYIKQNCTYLPRMKNVEMIINYCTQNKNAFEDTETLLIGNIIEYNLAHKNELFQALTKINEKLSNDGKINLIEKVQLLKPLETIAELKINGVSLKENVNSKNVRMALEKVRYDIEVEKVKNNIESILVKSDIWLTVNEAEFSRHIGYIIDTLTAFIKYNDYISEITLALKDIFDENALIQTLTAQENYIELANVLKDVISYNKYVEAKALYETQLDILESQTAKDFRMFENLVNVIKEKNIERLDSEVNRINNIYEVYNDYNSLKEKYPLEVNEFPKFIKMYIDMPEQDRKQLVSDFENIYAYYKLKMLFIDKEKKNQKFNRLLTKKDELQSEEKKLVIDLIAEKSWYNQINHMNNTICRALSEWLTLKTKLGKGTGKKANLIRKEMQEQMQTAKEAIPIWIMPVDKVVEQYPFNSTPQFDVVIMDESSQSSIVSITALLRGKKVIIVGDDKQISPIAIGILVEDLKALQNRYLKETRLGVGFDMETSLYDLAQNVCGSKKVVLKEHFRCLPEIIEFSNIHFYGNQINCLKVRGKENTIKSPIRTEYVPEGTVKRVSGGLVNQKEIDKVIEILKNIEQDETYNNKSIGIIVLQNSNTHINLITSEIWKNFNNEFIKDRKLKVGTTYDFQGDERDVIILSMVVSRVQDDGEINRVIAFTKKEFERSFNVAASRAKEQVILVHSIRADELSPECLRYKMITYYTTYNSENEREKVKLDVMESAFEKDFYNALKLKGIELTPQFKVGKYRIDFVVENENGKKVAIECDGDAYHTIEEFEKDLQRQDVLERCGWSFIRVRASEFYFDQEKAVKDVMKKIKEKMQ